MVGWCEKRGAWLMTHVFQWFFQCRRFRLHRFWPNQEGMIFMANFSFTALTDISSLEAPPFFLVTGDGKRWGAHGKIHGNSRKKNQGKMMETGDNPWNIAGNLLGDNPWARSKIIWAVAVSTLLGWWLVGGSYYLYILGNITRHERGIWFSTNQ